jgi:type II secretory pathway pseudopilin PulG
MNTALAARTRTFQGRARSPLRAAQSLVACPGACRPARARLRAAFTLLEVMVACGIFFMAIFAILALVSSTLRNARGLQRIQVDAGMAAAQVYQLLKTNRQADLYLSGDFGDSYPDYSWEAQSGEFDTNGLLVVDVVVNRRDLHVPFDTMSILIYSPDAKPAFGGFRR